MRAAFAMVIIVLLGAAGLSCAPATGPGKPTQYAAIATAGTGGTFYIVGAGMAKVINRHAPGVRATSETTAGSVENVRLLQGKKVPLAIVGNDSVNQSYRGEGPYKDKPFPELRAIAGAHATMQHTVVRAESPYQSVADLKGKRVGVGAAGSGTELKANLTLELHGLKRGVDFKSEYLSFTEQVAALKDGTIEAGFINAGIPASAVVDITTSQHMRLLPLSEDMIKKIRELAPEMYPYVIKVGTYRGMERDVLTIAYGSTLMAHKDMDESLAYAIAKALLEHSDELGEVHPSAKEYTIENTVANRDRIAAPLHPGAERFLREKGALK